MKSLALYIDKWYIVGAVCTDGITRPVNLPNGEERIWLYFYEDVANDEVSYSKGFQSKYRNNEPHYYGDVFSLITQSAAKYIMFKRPQDMKGIFKSAKIFDDLRKDMEAKEDDVISTYISFSKDVSLASRFLFIEELKKEKFEICESVARIDHLSLEYAAKKSQYIEDGYYLVLNACNENLHYSLYKKDEDLFTRIEEEVLNGMGTDVRSRALIEHVVDNINQRENFLKTDSERESEYLRMAQYVDNWLLKLSNARNMIPVQLTDITLSRDPYKDYSVQVKKGKIDERTDKIVSDIINVLTRFVNDLKVSHEQVKGILFLGNTFTNAQFKKDLNKHYNLDANKMVVYQDFELSSLVSAYTFIDCSQFIATKNEIRGNAEAELRRIQIAEQEANAKRLAKEEAEARALKDKESSDAERKFKDAMEMGYDAESKHDYVEMEKYFQIARTLCPDNEEANQKYEDALRKKAEHNVQLNNYKQRIQQAKSAFEKGDYETARMKAEEALSYMPESEDAQRIKNVSIRKIKSQEELKNYLVRIDLFIAKKAFKEAVEEIKKAKMLDVDYKEIDDREEKLKKEQEAVYSKVNELISLLDTALSMENFNEAIEVCNKLISEDFENSKKWTARLSQLNLQKDRAEENKKRWQELVRKIDSALIAEDWEKLYSLSKEALEIKDDAEIKTKFKKAEFKLDEIRREQEFKKKISEINELTVKKEFDEANAKLNSLERNLKEYGFIDDIKMKQIKDIRKSLFDFGQLPPKSTPQGRNSEKGGFDWESNNSSTKPKATSNTKKNSTKLTSDDFFEQSTINKTNTTKKSSLKQSGNITNNDFNF